MMLKLIGSFLFILCSIFISFLTSRKFSYRVEFLEEYLNFISYVETKIKYSSEPIINIITQYNSSSNIIKLFLKECKEKFVFGTSFYEAWKNSVTFISQTIKLNSNDIKILKKFGEELGTSDIDGQVTLCNLHKNLINLNLNEAKENQKKKSKLYITLGSSIGIVLILIVI